MSASNSPSGATITYKYFQTLPLVDRLKYSGSGTNKFKSSSKSNSSSSLSESIFEKRNKFNSSLGSRTSSVSSSSSNSDFGEQPTSPTGINRKEDPSWFRALTLAGMTSERFSNASVFQAVLSLLNDSSIIQIPSGRDLYKYELSVLPMLSDVGVMKDTKFAEGIRNFDEAYVGENADNDHLRIDTLALRVLEKFVDQQYMIYTPKELKLEDSQKKTLEQMKDTSERIDYLLRNNSMLKMLIEEWCGDVDSTGAIRNWIDYHLKYFSWVESITNQLESLKSREIFSSTTSAAPIKEDDGLDSDYEKIYEHVILIFIEGILKNAQEINDETGIATRAPGVVEYDSHAELSSILRSGLTEERFKKIVVLVINNEKYIPWKMIKKLGKLKRKYISFIVETLENRKGKLSWEPFSDATDTLMFLMLLVSKKEDEKAKMLHLMQRMEEESKDPFCYWYTALWSDEEFLKKAPEWQKGDLSDSLVNNRALELFRRLRNLHWPSEFPLWDMLSQIVPESEEYETLLRWISSWKDIPSSVTSGIVELMIKVLKKDKDCPKRAYMPHFWILAEKGRGALMRTKEGVDMFWGCFRDAIEAPDGDKYKIDVFSKNDVHPLVHLSSFPVKPDGFVDKVIEYYTENLISVLGAVIALENNGLELPERYDDDTDEEYAEACSYTYQNTYEPLYGDNMEYTLKRSKEMIISLETTLEEERAEQARTTTPKGPQESILWRMKDSLPILKRVISYSPTPDTELLTKIDKHIEDAKEIVNRYEALQPASIMPKRVAKVVIL